MLTTPFISLGALLGILGTSISAYFRNSDIRTIQNDIQKSGIYLNQQLENITKKMENGFEIKNKKEVKESWTAWSKRLSVKTWRWCTRQKSS